MDEEEKKTAEPEEREQEIVEPKVPSIDPEKILNYIRKKDRKALLTIFEIVPNIDIAEAVEDLSPPTSSTSSAQFQAKSPPTFSTSSLATSRNP